ncbi:MAG TPA: 2-oxoglutarate dehydrogenase E1 component [Acidobacteriota bacterium]|nr:2-oxoglutarate dehydrogenase E1 component [Acidobacteriota bacterium]
MSSSESPVIRKAASPVSASADFIEELYARWKEDPDSVSSDWGHFFRGFEMGLGDADPRAERGQLRVDRLVEAYRSRGHLAARTDPLGDSPAEAQAHLEFKRFGLGEDELDEEFETGLKGGPSRAPLRQIIETLRETYCGSVGVEYLHGSHREMHDWLEEQMEPVGNNPSFQRSKRLEILRQLTDAEVFENFLQRRYPGQKRFSLEGGESLLPAMHFFIEAAADAEIKEVVVGMAHRGRLNVLANILNKPYAEIFYEFEDVDPAAVDGDGDVKYHRGYSSLHQSQSGAEVKVSLTANPSHLEAVDPVVLGRTRAKQRRHDDIKERRKVVPLLLHGDAAFSGQGLVAEAFNLSELPGYRTGGTVHIVVNNQIGFTTSPGEARSTLYPTDVAKMVGAPILHVNGDDPEAVVYVTELALRFRQKFSKDVVIDLVCYRRHGHNEGDEPRFTQPQLYKKIENRPPVRELYVDYLLECCELSQEEAEKEHDQFNQRLQEELDTLEENEPEVVPQAFGELWEGLDKPYSHEPADTQVSYDTLVKVSRALTTVPEGFALNPKIKRALGKRMKAVKERKDIDWPFAELLAFGSLLTEGLPVRLSGQDSARGTFSQRHSVWQDTETQESYIPLDHVGDGQERFCVYNSMLSEAGVLGFDFGYAYSEPHMLVLWEAQFGDFANGAQVIIDQFIVSSQSKWKRTAGLVMLLPHGYEGQGPEHSNAYLERYLAACAEDNIQVVNLTTPANYFHVLRRQLKRPFRRPLIVMAPKSLLRHKLCVSPLDDLVEGRFNEVLDDPSKNHKAKRLVLCSGKVFYDLLQRRDEKEDDSVALVRVEQFYPYPETQLRQVVEHYSKVEEVVWAQEESANRGGWMFMQPRLRRLFFDLPVHYVGRDPSSSPATGYHTVHKREQEELVEAVFQSEEQRPEAVKGGDWA